MHAAVLMSFTADYELGHITFPYNKQYADKHGYDFVCKIWPPSDWMTDKSKRHPTWDKVEMIIELLTSLLRGGGTTVSADTTHLLWVDADAVVLNHATSLEQLWTGVPSSTELLIGEDLSTTCLVNCGVFCVRVSEWSLKLWTDVWASPMSVRWHRSPHREQSALLKQLVARGEGLNHVPLPFHSYCGGPKLKLFPHVAVLPRHAINTNRGDVRQRTPVSSSGDDEEGRNLTYRCDFVFHAAGRPVLMRDGNDAHHPPRYCSSKEEALRAMLVHRGLSLEPRQERVDTMDPPACANALPPAPKASCGLVNPHLAQAREKMLSSPGLGVTIAAIAVAVYIAIARQRA